MVPLSMWKGTPNNVDGNAFYIRYTLSHSAFYTATIEMRSLEARCESKVERTSDSEVD